jgi:P2 family phage contractile tail tube protein
MAAGEKLLSKWAIWVDGVGKAGNAKEYTPPSLTVKTVDFKAGDMDMSVPVDDGMEAMQADWTIYGVDPLAYALFGMTGGTKKQVTVRSTYTDRDGNAHTLTEVMRGMITEITRDGQSNDSHRDKGQKTTMKLDYYKVTYDALPLVEIDAENGTRSLGGVDVLEAARAALSLI